MPIYEYSCRRCHHDFEYLVVSASENIRCPQCDAGAVEKQLSVFNSRGARGEERPSGGGCGGCSPQGCGCH
jgi:putative FmdB family regulatory protein